eukprot:6471003-Pyramimonas_sp.AAC.1
MLVSFEVLHHATELCIANGQSPAASLESMLSKSPRSSKSSNVVSGCSETQRNAHALAGRPEALPKLPLAIRCHPRN